MCGCDYTSPIVLPLRMRRNTRRQSSVCHDEKVYNKTGRGCNEVGAVVCSNSAPALMHMSICGNRPTRSVGAFYFLQPRSCFNKATPLACTFQKMIPPDRHVILGANYPRGQAGLEFEDVCRLRLAFLDIRAPESLAVGRCNMPLTASRTQL